MNKNMNIYLHTPIGLHKVKELFTECRFHYFRLCKPFKSLTPTCSVDVIYHNRKSHPWLLDDVSQSF